MSGSRLLLYISVAAWLGSAQQSWFNAVFERETDMLITTSVISIALIAILVLMGWQDYRRGQVHS